MNQTEPAQTPARPRVRRPRLTCLLDRPLLKDCEPLGFMGWEIMLGPTIACDISPWIPDDVGGRLLFVASPEQVQSGGPGPLRTMPLLLWLTHRSLRALYLCTPSEAMPLGQRLAQTAAFAVGAQVVEECAPAVMAELLQRWIEADPLTQALRLPLPPGKKLPLPPPAAAYWCVPWAEAQLRALPDIRRMAPSAWWAPALYPDWKLAEVHTYEDEPLLLAPLNVMTVAEGVGAQQIVDAFSQPDRAVLRPLTMSVYPWVVCAALPRMALALAPLQAEGWRDEVRAFRDALSQRLNTRAVCMPVLGRQVASLIEIMYRCRAHLHAKEEVYRPPMPGAKASLPRRTRAVELRRRLMNAVALPLPASALLPLPMVPEAGDAQQLH